MRHRCVRSVTKLPDERLEPRLIVCLFDERAGAFQFTLAFVGGAGDTDLAMALSPAK